MPQPDRGVLVDMAARIIAEHGLDELSLTSLAERAGTSRASVYRMFKGRDDLLAAIARMEMERMVTAAAGRFDVASNTATLIANLTRFGLSYLRDHKALNTVRRKNPESLLTLVVRHGGEQMYVVVDMVAAYIEPFLAVDEHRNALELSPRQAGEVLARTVLSHFLMPSNTLSDREIADTAARALCRKAGRRP